MAVEPQERETIPLRENRIICVSRMELADLDEVMKIEQCSFPVPWSRGLYEKEIKSKNRSAIAAVARYKFSSEVIAHAVWWLIADECHLANIAVAPEYRRQGVGDAMLRACFHDTVRRRMKYIVLEVRQSNTAAQNLYTKYGFNIMAIRRGYYQDNDEDAFVMMLNPVPDLPLEGLEVHL